MNARDDTGLSGDKMLWIAGGAVGVIAIAFLAFMNMGAPDTTTAITTSPSIEADQTSVDNGTEVEATVRDFSVQLNRARLAVDAQMLTEPEGYSAWNIYTEILDADAGNSAAADGLEMVTARIIDQAFEALNTGQRDTAEQLAERVLSRFADHTEANEVIELARRTVVAENSAPEARPELPRSPLPTAVALTIADPTQAPIAPEPPAVDPVVAIYSQFTLALADGALRAPADNNAVSYVAAMRAEGADHAMTIDAEQQLFDALFARHSAAFDELDTNAALEWLESADDLQVDSERVAAARNQILDFVAVQAATEPVAASQLTVRSYVPPEYPITARRRGVEGWVDVAFVLSREGRPISIEVTDDSNSIFRDAATRAVEQWEFEPHTVHERIVEQHAETRIRFMLAD